MRIGGVPHAYRVGVVANQLFEMCGERFAIDLGRGAAGADTLADFKNDAREAVLVDIDLLVVGDLTQLARELVNRQNGQTLHDPGIMSLVVGGGRLPTHLTSAKFSGRSATMAEPKRGVDTNSVLVIAKALVRVRA